MSGSTLGGIREYIRFESACRYHAVILTLAGGSKITVCSRIAAPEQIHSTKTYAPALCRGCKSRLTHPYLMPRWLKEWAARARMERCDAEIREIRAQAAGEHMPAWLVALGQNDWEVERALIAQEVR